MGHSAVEVVEQHPLKASLGRSAQLLPEARQLASLGKVPPSNFCHADTLPSVTNHFERAHACSDGFAEESTFMRKRVRPQGRESVVKTKTNIASNRAADSARRGPALRPPKECVPREPTTGNSVACPSSQTTWRGREGHAYDRNDKHSCGAIRTTPTPTCLPLRLGRRRKECPLHCLRPIAGARQIRARRPPAR